MRAKFLNLWSKNDFDNLTNLWVQIWNLWDKKNFDNSTYLYEVNRYLFYNISVQRKWCPIARD